MSASSGYGSSSAQSSTALIGPSPGVSMFRWLEVLEKEFDKAFVDVDLLLGEIDPDQADITYEGRQKMTSLSSCFAQLCHKAQTVFQLNHKLEVYEDTLEGVYLMLRREVWEGPVDHQRFWEVAKSQMNRVCTLEETATNYVNWKMIENLPYYKLYMVSGNSVYLVHLQNFLQRKQLVHSWINLEDNAWVRNLLPDDLYTVLEYHSKISQGGGNAPETRTRAS
ncbi:unnamed protein product [Merluccius merluccius]